MIGELATVALSNEGTTTNLILRDESQEFYHLPWGQGVRFGKYLVAFFLIPSLIHWIEG